MDRDGNITAEELIKVIEKLGGSMSEGFSFVLSISFNNISLKMRPGDS